MSGSASVARGLIGVVVLAALGALVGVVVYRGQVLAPDPRFEREALLAVVAQETPVYYRDGVTRLGVFFGDEHRTYLPWEALPTGWVFAIVAAEDGRFWGHPGIDGWGVTRAMVQNLQAGRVVSGGSTLTQQTVKNLFYRPDNSLRSKVREAVDALKLEARYDKTDILAFYANQFHVTGNGRGLAVAARYFFDKDLTRAAEDPTQRLDLVESAFLAGLVKGPALYDPFQGDAARRAAATARAEARVRYVLGRIVDVSAEDLAGFAPDDPDIVEKARLTQALAARMLEQPITIPFRKGAFRFPSDTVLDEVRRRLRRPPLSDVLARHGGDDLETAGLKVITTLDVAAQRAAVYGLRHALTEAGTMVERATLDAYKASDPAPAFDPNRPPVARAMRRGVVTAAAEDASGRAVLDLDLGGHPCRVDRDGLVRVAAAIGRGRTGRPWDKVDTDAVDAVVAGLPVGTVVHASVRAVSDAGVLCDLEASTALQGAVLVTEDGQIRAMVGGRDNRDFNRATARRQLGSTWKTVVLHAALSLGWRATDPLDNRRAVFPFSASAYAPSPDHDSADTVSLAWAGVRSENLATVWLLYHLVDRLDGAEIARLAREHGLARAEGESSADWRRRLATAGVDLSSGAEEEAWLLAARDEVAAGLRAGGPFPQDLVPLMSVTHGRPLDRARGVPGDAGAWAAQWRQETVWREIVAMRGRCAEAWAVAADAVGRAEVPPPYLPLGYALREGGVIAVGCEVDDGFGAFDPLWLAGPEPVVLAEDAATRVGRLHAATIDAVANAVQRRRIAASLSDGDDDEATILSLQDVRILLGLRVMQSTARALGVGQELPPVLSLPLGAVEITLEEAVSLYEGLALGRRWAFPGLEQGPSPQDVPSPKDPALLVLEIRDLDDRVLYRARGEPEAFGSEVVAHETRAILTAAVAHGTGRRASGLVQVGGAAVPLAGKTGTTNGFRNAAFLGVVPVVGRDALDGAWVIGTYVGFDDNAPMTNRAIRLAGASGALPVWMDTVAGLAEAGLLSQPGAVAPEGGWQWDDDAALTDVIVDESTGLPLEPGASGLVLRARPAATP